MLTAIKERASGWIAYTLVGFISIPFVLWGINSYFEGASKITVASVNGVEVDQAIYQQALSEQRRSLVQMMGRNVDAEIFASEPFKLQVLESLIDTRLQAEYLADRGYRITNEQLSSRIAAFAAFQTLRRSLRAAAAVQPRKGAPVALLWGAESGRRLRAMCNNR